MARCSAGILVCVACWLCGNMLSLLSRSSTPPFVASPALGGRLPGTIACEHASASFSPRVSAVPAGTTANVCMMATAVAMGLMCRMGSRNLRKARGSCRFRTVCAGKKRGGGGKAAPAAQEGGEEVEVDIEALLKEYQEKMDSTTDILRTNLVPIRAGKAAPELLDGLKVNAYESEVAINEVGTISATDSTTLTVSLFDESVAGAVEKAVRTSSLGFSVTTAGAMVRIGIPPLTKDKRQQYSKLAKDFYEQSKVAVRNVRQGAMKKIKGLKKSLSEDLVKSLEKDVEALVKKATGECDKIFKAKEKEILNN